MGYGREIRYNQRNGKPDDFVAGSGEKGVPGNKKRERADRLIRFKTGRRKVRKMSMWTASYQRNMILEEIKKWIQEEKEEEYGRFLRRIVPNLEAGQIQGVRTPKLRKYAKELSRRREIGEFLTALPHGSFEENQLHAFLLEGEKEYEVCLEKLEIFLPYVDNWATCDQLSPKIFKKHRRQLLERIPDWLASQKTYTVRYGIGMLLIHFLEEDFQEEYLDWVAQVDSEEYYVNMMIAWYFATALAKQYRQAILYLEAGRLPRWVHNKTIQKGIESNRISKETKDYLRSLRR